jgi:hypothetical protein
LVCFYGSGNWTQGLTNARQVFYHSDTFPAQQTIVSVPNTEAPMKRQVYVCNFLFLRMAALT